MNIKPKHMHKGDIIRGLELLTEPYKIDGSRDLRADLKCIFCGTEIKCYVLSELKRRVFDGCGCQKTRKNSVKWKSFKDWCVENSREDLLDCWDYEMNVKCPDNVSYCTADEYYFKCKKDLHKSTSWKLINLTRRSKVKDICKYCNSFAQKFIEQYGEDKLSQYWDYEKNEKSPWEVSCGEDTVIYIKCQNNPKHGSYDTLPSLFLKKHIGCAYCNSKGRRIHPDDTFAAYYKNKYGDDFIDKYWDFNKNTLDPYQITPSTNKDYIWLYCSENPNHGSYKIMPNNFKRNGFSCPECYHEREDSTLQISVSNYLCDKYSLDISHEFDCSIVCKNPQTFKALPYDNEVTINGRHLIIEVNGEQHYNKHCGWNRKEAKRRNTTPEQAFSDQQYRDRIKKEYALSQGYAFLEIPYWTEKDGSYKTLIDDKILSLTQQNDLPA